MACCLFASVGLSSTVFWDGGGNGTDWHDPLNWSGHSVPTLTNDVVIDLPGTNVTVTIASSSVSIRSLQCQESLDVSGGNLTVTGGSAVIAGSLIVVSNRSLTATGTNASLTATGPTEVSGASLYALNGATLSLPQLASYRHTGGNGYDRVLQASGAGSVLDLSGVTNVVGSTNFYTDLSIQALAGGRVDLSGVREMTLPGTSYYQRGI